VLLGLEVGGLDAAERAALRARVAFLLRAVDCSATSTLENIVLPLGFHTPERPARRRGRGRCPAQELGADPHGLSPSCPKG